MMTSIEIWGSILDNFFINHTLRPGTLARRTPFRSHRQQAALLSKVSSLRRIPLEHVAKPDNTAQLLVLVV